MQKSMIHSSSYGECKGSKDDVSSSCYMRKSNKQCTSSITQSEGKEEGGDVAPLSMMVQVGRYK